MTLTKTQLRLLLVAAVAVVLGMIYREYRHASDRKAKAELAKLTVTLSPTAPRATVMRAATSPVSVSVRPSAAPAIMSPPPATIPVATPAYDRSAEMPDRVRERERMHHRYDLFFQQQQLTPEQGEHFIDLIFQIADARADLQAAVREQNLAGGTAEVEAVRSQLYAPYIDQMKAMLGADGYLAYTQYEAESFARVAYLEPLQALFNAANVTLSPTENGQLLQIIQRQLKNERVNATDLGMRTSVDWDAVAREAETSLPAGTAGVIAQYAKSQAAPK